MLEDDEYIDIKSTKDEIYKLHYPEKDTVPSTPAEITDFMDQIWVDD